MKIFKLIFNKISKVLSARGIYITKSLSYKSSKQSLPPSLDYVRYAALDLCQQEIKSNEVGGSIAELGVYKGDFAKRLNALFPDKTLYLFDTFEGFDKKDIPAEIANKFSMGKQDFSDTSVEVVLSKMTVPAKCVVRKGFFPETAEGVNDTFCFVNIDADLYDPIKNGLKFFYPRLERGGFIFVHDFNNDEYKGARKAVQEYCSEHNIGYMPLPDECGTVVIAK